jgi:hypothetical protein
VSGGGEGGNVAAKKNKKQSDVTVKCRLLEPLPREKFTCQFVPVIR